MLRVLRVICAKDVADGMWIFFVTEIPKTAMGKVRRDVLADMVVEKAGTTPKLSHRLAGGKIQGFRPNIKKSRLATHHNSITRTPIEKFIVSHLFFLSRS